MENNENMEHDELYHHGVKGMQWGRRLYQNQDGSLTALGRARYAVKKARTNAKRKATIAKKKRAAANEQKALELKKKQAAAKRKATINAKKKAELEAEKKANQPPKLKKSVNEMSDAELKKAIARARDEDAYLALRPEKVPGIKKFMGSLMKDVVGPAATVAGKEFLTDALKKVGKNLLKDQVDPNSIEALTSKRDKLKLKKEIDDLVKPKNDEMVELTKKRDKLKLEKEINDYENPKSDPYAESNKYWENQAKQTAAKRAAYTFEKMKYEDYKKAEAAYEADQSRKRQASSIINNAMNDYANTPVSNLLPAPKDDK